MTISGKSEIGLLTKKHRKEAIERIIDYFETERDEKVGVIAAEDLLEMFLEDIGIDLYNKGVEDAEKFLRDRHQQILIDLESLLKKQK